MLGDSGRSYVVGFGENPPKQPHHKAASCESPPAQCTWDTFSDTSKDNPHELLGALVGGPSNEWDSYVDDRTNYITNEVTLDYNAGFQGAVAGLRSLACGNSSTTPSPASTQGTTPVTSSTSEGPSSSTSELSSTSSQSPTTSPSSGYGCDVEITNSWANNIQGKIRLTVPSEISDFSIILNTDIALTGIQVIIKIFPYSQNENLNLSFTLQTSLLLLAHSSLSITWTGSVDCRLARHSS